ncbi:DUF2357 domain-containing protein [Microvenator marinus]|uniref:DUF2357 domain-containing protein n=1 Tax=Microvenator marinus TaxID=2600177 RepID=A0A5B8XVJ9_9DELT|nr:DUF2357 domain-containing protein [Microvenator marinus]QED29942.1 DUF2357 domain-containing protein [Microvenator marinus]
MDFQNHVGRRTLPIRYKLRSGQMVDEVFECEVHATKLDIQTDYRDLSAEIDRAFPLWRYSLNALTDGSEGKGRQGPHFPLLWLKRFESLHHELADGVRRVLNAPHNRLTETVRWKKPAQIKGALSPRQEERIKEGLQAGHFERRYAITEKRLHVDTMENRFVKMVVAEVCRNLKRFASELSRVDGEHETFSEAFVNQIVRWKEPFETNLNHPLFREVGDFRGMMQESLTLQGRAGYSEVYRCWEELKLYFNVLDQGVAVGTKTIAQLYEVWCLLEVKRLLVDELGFVETRQRVGCLFWLFDAKYRLNPDMEPDRVPDDAINQMHRFRDAITRQVGPGERVRPVVGAFALYPGFFHQSAENMEAVHPYFQEVDEVGIGAFPLLPSPDGRAWLTRYFKERFGVVDDRVFAWKSARIPTAGMRHERYTNLTMVVTGPPQRIGQDDANPRSQDYLEGFRSGAARWFHMRFEASEREGIDPYIIREVRFLVISDRTVPHQAYWVWPVLNVELKPRNTLRAEQAGGMSTSTADYWLFELGPPQPLPNPLANFPQRGHHLKFVSLPNIWTATSFATLPSVYEFLSTAL